MKVFEAAEKDPATKEKDAKKPEGNEHLKSSDKELKETLQRIQKESQADKSAAPGVGTQFQKAMNDLTLSIEAQDLKGRQRALTEIAKLEGSFKPTATKTLEAFSAKSEDGVTNLRQLQVQYARAAASGGDDKVMALVSPSLKSLADPKNDAPKARVNEMLQLGVAGFTLTSGKYVDTFMKAQALDMAKELRQGIKTQPMAVENMSKILDILFAIQKNNPQAKELLASLGITDEKGLKAFKESLTSDSPEETRKSINRDLNPVISDQEKALALDLKKFADAQPAVKSAEAPKDKASEPSEKSALKLTPAEKLSVEQLTAVDLALFDILKPNGARDLAKRLAEDKDGVLAKKLFGEGGVPERLKTWVQMARSSGPGRPFNEEGAREQIGETLLNRKDQLEKVVDKAARPDSPFYENQLKYFRDWIAACKEVHKADLAVIQANLDVKRDYEDRKKNPPVPEIPGTAYAPPKVTQKEEPQKENKGAPVDKVPSNAAAPVDNTAKSKDTTENTKPAQEQNNLKDLPRTKLTQEALQRLITAVDLAIQKQNLLAKEQNPEAPEKPKIDQTKLNDEWKRGEFGPESRRFWAEAQTHMNQEAIDLTIRLKARGLSLPPGSPLRPAPSKTGSGFPETDEMYGSRLKHLPKAEAQKVLEPGQLPSESDVNKFINTYAFVQQAGTKWAKAFLEGHTTYVEQKLKGVEAISTAGNLDGWKRPKDATIANPDRLERWNHAAESYTDVALKVKNYAETIGAFNAATRTDGKDWPQLQDLFRHKNGLDQTMTMFSDKGLEDFPGRVERNPDHSVKSMVIDLPATLDRNNAEDAAKMDAWLEKYGPEVDKVSLQLLKMMDDPNRLLINFEDDEVSQSMRVKADEAADFKKKNKLTGDAKDDVGKPVTPPKGGDDWRVKSVNADGSYELERRTEGKYDKDGKLLTQQNPQEFNMKRMGFTVSGACDAKGNPDPKGDYFKVEGYKDYFHKNALAYNNWNVGGIAVERKERDITMQGIFHKNDYVAIFDNGRTRLMQAKNLGAWQSSYDSAKMSGEVVNLAVDVGMAASGTLEFRAGYMAAKEGGLMAIKAGVKEGAWHLGMRATGAGLKEGGWHLGLAATGFGKSAIEEYVWGGHQLMQARHYLIMLDMTASLAPGAKAAALGKVGRLFGVAERAPGEIGATEAFLKQPFSGANLLQKLNAPGAAIDQAFLLSHKVMDGVELGKYFPKVGKYAPFTYLVPKLGVMPMADWYMIAQFSDTVAAQRSRGGDRGQLVEAMREHRKPSEGQLPFYGTGDIPSAAAVKKTTEAVLGNWSNKLGDAQKEKGPAAEQIEKAVKEAALLPADNPDRKRCFDTLLETYAGINQNSSRGEKLAAAHGLIELSKGASDKATTLGVVQKAGEERRRHIYTEDVKKFAANTGDVAVELLKRTGTLDSLPANDPKRDENIALAVNIFRNTNATDHERVAAAALLMTLRISNDPDQLMGSPYVKAKDVISYLRATAHTSDSLNVRLVAGELLLRTHRISEGTLQSQQAQLVGLTDKLSKTPNDEKLKSEVEESKTLVEKSEAILKVINYNTADYGGLCMDVLRNPNASRELKLQAIASPVGPGLALLVDELKNKIEPALMQDTNAVDKMRGIGGLYGRDAYAIENCLREVAADSKQHADVRALACQALANTRLERNTIDLVPLTPGLEYKVGTDATIKTQGAMVSPQHASVRVGHDGKQEIKDLGNSKDGTFILRAGQKIQVGSEWTAIKPGDRVFLGTPEPGKGTELIVSHERMDGLAELGAKAALDAKQAGSIADKYYKGLRTSLETPLMPPTFGKFNEAQEQLVEKFRSVMSAMDLGPSAFGIDEKKHQQMIAQALADCVQRTSPEVAAAALRKLSPDLLKSLSPTQTDALRERTLTSVISLQTGLPPKAENVALRLAVTETMPVLFADGTEAQKRRAAGMLSSMTIPSASINAAQEATATDRGKYLYPSYPADLPGLREAALRSLVLMDLPQAAENAKLLLLGGTFAGKQLQPDVAAMRMASLDILEKARPEEFHTYAVQALRIETDPAVAAKLWNVEYGARRPEADRGRLQLLYEALEAKIKTRARPGLAEDSKRVWDAFKPDIHLAFRVSDLYPLGIQKGGDQAIAARLACIHVVATHETSIADSAANTLRAATGNNGKALAQELSGPLEYALLSNLRADGGVRDQLVRAYMNLQPGENGIATKAEAAIVLLKVLENEQSRIQKTDKNSNEYKYSINLQKDVLRYLADLPCESLAPSLRGLAAGHSDPEIKKQALEIANKNRDTTVIARQLAEAELRAIENKGTADPNFKDKFGPRATTEEISRGMAEPLSISDRDSTAVVKALHLGMLSKPIEGENDPRLKVLYIAAQDKSDSVRAEAAYLLSYSPNARDREQAVFIAADIAKNSASAGLKEEAQALLEQFRKNNPKGVERALAETPNAQRVEAAGPEAVFKSNPKAQRAFEDVRRRLTEGQQESISWDHRDWENFCTSAKLPLLTFSGVFKEQEQAAAQVDKNRGSFTNFTTRESVKEAERKAAKATIAPKIPGQVSELVGRAMATNDVGPEARATRQALAYIVLSNGSGLYDHKEDAVKQAVEGIAKICSGSGPGRGEMEWVLRTLLTNKPDLAPQYRKQLLAGLDTMTGDKGTISRENGTGIAALALEQEVRFGQPGNQESLQYQKDLLTYLEKHGNQDLAPALEVLFKNHPDKAVQDRAAAVLGTIRQRASSATDVIVSQMVADLDQNRIFSPLDNDADKRIQGLKTFMNDASKNPEQRLRAAEILLYPGNRGVTDADRKAAASTYAAVGLSLTKNEARRYKTADRILDGTNKLFTDAERNSAITAMKELSNSTDPLIHDRSALMLEKIVPVGAR